jgi:hypothetical protein
MRGIIIILTGVLLNVSLAKASIKHWGYCSQFESQNSCQQYHTPYPDYKTYCICPGEPVTRPPVKFCHPMDLVCDRGN